MEKVNMAKRFQGKVAVVTASTQGIGLGVAERLGLEGASVVISSRKQVCNFVNSALSEGIKMTNCSKCVCVCG